MKFLKRILPRTLLGRSLLIIVSPLILLQVISTWVFYDRHYDTITKRLAQAIAGEIAAVLVLLERNDDSWDRQAVISMAQRTMDLDVRFQAAEALPVPKPPPFINTNRLLDSKLTEALGKRFSYPFSIDTQSRPEHVEILVELPDGLLQVLVRRKRLFSSTTYIFIMWMVGASIVLFAVATVFMRNQVRPIRRLAVAADSFGKGRDVPGFRPEGAREVRQAAAAFQLMRERIKRQIRQRTEMLAGVSHDLRTPLTRMKLQIAMLGNSPEADNLKSDVDEMERMVDGYLAFARGEGTERPRPTELSTLLRDVVAQSSREGGEIDLHIEQDVILPLRREAFRRCLNNLVANARTYGNRISLTAGLRRRTVEIIVDDDGPGIPAESREDVFKPFFRLDHSRNPETGGTGLGLTIARDVVRSHGGDLALDVAPGGGLRARIRMPI